jgi:hypothetical protein
MRRLIAGYLMFALSTGAFGMVASAQSGAKEETKKAGEAAKDAGKDSADAAKHVGKATAKTAKKGAAKVKKAVTGDAHATCVDGTRQEGTTEANAAAACASHGGVAKQ